MSSANEAGVQRLKDGMPSIDHLESSLKPKHDLGKIIGVYKFPDVRGMQITDGFVRLVDKAVIEYRESRSRLIKFLAQGMADDGCRASYHFESCIQSLHKAINYIERLRHLGYSRGDNSPLIPKPRDMTVLQENVKSEIRKFRDAIEHLDNDIIDGRLPENQIIGVHLGWKVATVGKFHLAYKNIVKWLEQLHEIAAILSRVHLTQGDQGQT